MRKTAVSLLIVFALSPISRAGFAGSALQFDGDNDFAFAYDSSSLDISSEVTMECWLKLNAMDFSQVQIVFGKRDAYKIYPENHVYGGTGNWKGQINGTEGDLYGTNLSAGQWTHLALTYDGSTMRIYLNGEEEGQRTFTNGMDVSNYNLSFGIEQSTMEYALDGVLDEARLWDVALTREQIQGNMYSLLQGNESNLVSYWNFDEGVGQVANDLTANGNHAYLGVDPDNPDVSDPLWIQSGAPIVPEPATVLLIALGGLVLRRKK